MDESVPHGLVLDEARREVRIDSRPIAATPAEFALLGALMRAPGVAVASRELLSAMWGRPWLGRTAPLHLHVSRLRSKLGESGASPRHIVAVRGFGYRLEPDPDGLAPAGGQDWVELAHDADLILRSVAPHAPFLGWEPDDVIGTQFSLLGVDAVTTRSLIDQNLAMGVRASRLRAEVAAADGSRLDAEITGEFLVDARGAFAGMRGQFRVVGAAPYATASSTLS